MAMTYDYVRVKDVMLEKSIYQALTKLKYGAVADEASISSLINDMLKEYLHTYMLSKSMGHMLVSKSIVKAAVDSMSDEQIKEASATNAMRYKEGAIIEHGRPSLAAYLELIRSFAKANKFDIEISKNPDNGNQVLVMSFKMGDKFSQLKANTYRMILEEFAVVDRIEMTGTTTYFEFHPKKEIVQESK